MRRYIISLPLVITAQVSVQPEILSSDRDVVQCRNLLYTMVMSSDEDKSGLRIVALFEAAKGLLVLLTGFDLLTYIHKDLHLAAVQIVRHFHLNPASRYPRIFLDLADRITDGQLWLLAFSALLYAAVRFIEAYGLWRERPWAEWFGLLMGGVYVPLELFELMRGATWPKAVLLMVNAGVTGYLMFVVYRARDRRKHRCTSSADDA